LSSFKTLLQGTVSRKFWGSLAPGKFLKVLDFLVKFAGPGKSLKMTLVLEVTSGSPGKFWKSSITVPLYLWLFGAI